MSFTMEQYQNEGVDLVQRMTELSEQADFNPENPDFKRMQDRFEEVGKQIEGLKRVEDLRGKLDHLRGMVGRTPVTPTAENPDDLGETLLRSERWKNYVRGGGTGNHRLMSVPMNLRAPLTTASFPSVKDRVVAPAPTRQNPLLGVVNSQRVSSGSVEVVYYPAAAPLAAVVAEGALKPEAALTISLTTVTLETLAHTAMASRQLLEDEVRMRDFIGGNLTRGVSDKAEAQLATVIQGGTYVPAAGASMAEAVRVGIANVQNAGFSPNGILINPTDAATLDVAVWQTSLGAPSVGGSLWGVPIIPVGAIAAGSAFVGDFTSGVDFFYRGDVDLFVTDSDVLDDGSSAFRKNIISFLAEMRCKGYVVRPEAISETAVTPPVGTRSAETKPAPQTAPQTTKK